MESIKITKLESDKPSHAFIALIPPITHTPLYTIESPPNTILIEPFVSLDDITTLVLGKNLFSLIEPTDTQIKPYLKEIKPAKEVYIKINSLFNVDYFFKQMKYIRTGYKTNTYEIIQITDTCNKATHEFTLVNDLTKIFMTNMPVHENTGYEKDEVKVQQVMYTSLFCPEELDKHGLRPNHVMVMKGELKSRRKEICQKAAYCMKANHLYIDFECKTSKTLFRNIYEARDCIIVFENFFESGVVNFVGICEFIRNCIKEGKNRLFFVFVLESAEDEEKVCSALGCDVVKYRVEIPVVERDGKVVSGLVGKISHSLSRREVMKVNSMCCGIKITEMENILRDVISRALFDKRKCKDKDKEYLVTFKDFVEVIGEKEARGDIKLTRVGWFRRILDRFTRK